MKYGFVKVASAIPGVRPGNCKYNTESIINLMLQAEEENADIVCFPELSITGYTCQDLFESSVLIKEAEKSLDVICKATRNLNTIEIVGLPLVIGNFLANCAVVLHRGEIIGVVPKTYLPNYKEFYEQRWFASASNIKEQEIKTGEDKDGVWEDSEKNYLLCEYGRICYTSKDYYFIYSNLLYDGNGVFRDNFDELIADGKVNGISKEKAIKKMRDIAKSNGIMADNVVAYPFTIKNMTKLSKMFMSDKEYEEYKNNEKNKDDPIKRKFYKKDEAYLVVMNVMADDKILYNKEYDYGNRGYSGSYCYGIVSAKGVEAFDADGIYEKLSIDKDSISILSEKQAIDKLDKRFEDVISGKIKCNRLSITYIAIKAKKNDNSYAVIPVYLFDITQEIIDKKTNETYIESVSRCGDR